MYTHCTDETVKNYICSAMCNAKSRLRVLICTVAFGMGINCAAVMKVIHWGPPPDIESYMQETGRGGRDGSPCSAVLFLKHSHLRGISQEMKDYA